MDKKHDVFICYNRCDYKSVKTIFDKLIRDGIDVWIDKKDIYPGDIWREKIEEAINKSRMAIIFIGKNGRGPNQNDEISMLDGIQKKDATYQLIPVYLKNAADESSKETLFTSPRDYIDFRVKDPNPYERLMDIINKEIEGAGKSKKYHRPFSTLSTCEWAVHEITDDYPEFLSVIQHLHDKILEKNKKAYGGVTSEIVITLYTRLRRERGVGQFEYDLVYHRNLRDDSPMFGPIVKNDDRTKFICDTTTSYEFDLKVKDVKSDGFVEREDVVSSARFKLGGGGDLRIIGKDPNAKVDSDNIVGLLFVNGRVKPIIESIFREQEITDLMIELEEIIEKIAKLREKNFSNRNDKLFTALDNISFPSDNSPSNIHEYISSFVMAVFDAKKYENVAFSVYLLIEDKSNSKKVLKWIWSNTSTSTHETIKLRDKSPDSLLISDVAIDSNNKPLLIHKLQDKKRYKEKAIRTGLVGSAGSNLIVPILLTGTGCNAKLTGILDLQSKESHQFDTEDVQMLYRFARRSEFDRFLNKLANEPESTRFLPLHTDIPYAPVQKQPLKFNVHDLLSLNFNPMKFLLHWPKISELITTGITNSPSTIEVWPSMKCNHHCTWCRTDKDRNLQFKKKREMTENELVDIAHDIMNNFTEVDVLISGGGEPLLHTGLHKFMKSISEINGTIGIFTNGTRPHSFRFWEEFCKRKDRHRFIRVSFNGHDPESYYKIHFNGEDLSKHAIMFCGKICRS
ncbi:MAG: TIR domain-containing protein [Gammaproteobacteria bacterium]|nr:TIR domain-containing protein [Gammaproteobacteria bacterium]